MGGPERERESDDVYEQHFSVRICLKFSHPRTDDGRLMLILVQCGQARLASTTLADIHGQLWIAARGVAKTVADMQTESGVKDALAEYWIQQLITKAREEQQRRIRNPETRDHRLRGRRIPNRAAIVSEIERTIQADLMKWLVTQPDWDYDSLPKDSCMSSRFSLLSGFYLMSYIIVQRTELRPGVHFSALLMVEGMSYYCPTTK